MHYKGEGIIILPMMANFKTFILALLILLPSLTYGGDIPLSYIIKGVPFYPQLDYYCGPASLASVINYWGGNVTQEEIGAKIYRKELKGSLSLDLLLYAREKGFRAEMIRGDIERLKSEILKGRPVIAFINLGFRWLPRWHYVVVFGYDDRREELITHSGRERIKRFSYKRFIKMWEKTDYWALIITPMVGDKSPNSQTTEGSMEKED